MNFKTFKIIKMLKNTNEYLEFWDLIIDLDFQFAYNFSKYVYFGTPIYTNEIYDIGFIIQDGLIYADIWDYDPQKRVAFLPIVKKFYSFLGNKLNIKL